MGLYKASRKSPPPTLEYNNVIDTQRKSPLRNSIIAYKNNTHPAHSFNPSKKTIMSKEQNMSATMVIRSVSPQITTLSVPFLRFNRFKFGGRATIGIRAFSNLPKIDICTNMRQLISPSTNRKPCCLLPRQLNPGSPRYRHLSRRQCILHHRA